MTLDEMYKNDEPAPMNKESWKQRLILLAQFKQQPGYQLFDMMLAATVQLHEQALLNATDPMVVMREQGSLRTAKAFQVWLDNEMKVAQMQMQQYEADGQ